MENEVLIKVENVSKKFCKDLNLGLLYGLQDLGSGFFGNNKVRDLRKKEFWAVDDISFEVRRGECLGLLGHNGAGKSTLLKVLTGLIAPDRGQITMKGRVNALIELTAGFNPILTGRENIYNNGAVLGLTEKEIDAKYDEIVAFSELEEFIDTPVQYYSSGMKVRLGFSVAAFTEPDVLILDEVLAVGDVGFRIKSFNKTLEIMQNAAVIFVSHSMPDVTRTCNQVLFMRHGKSYYHGTNIHKGIDLYLNEFNNDKLGLIEMQDGAELSNFKINNEPVIFQNNNSLNKPIPIPFGKDIVVEFDVDLKKELAEYFAIIRISDKDMKVIGSVYTNRFNGYFKGEKKSTIKIDLKDIRLIDGEYSITYMLAVNTDNNSDKIKEWLCIYRDYVKFKVEGLELADYAPIFFESEVKQTLT
ncbi:ABC transporter ATP-binding protein [Empedobacter stercoris]|uniref:ABC transporter ATP-binding protein n=1 Tax=Empedobacter stercoris TaxID=1628248 RepID=UPI0021AE7F39|nr:ABC transporter ATP-binding protein [Empedobacter stercoris]UWX65747.1 ABC transporter ATP-binding protein [Empedobacter stercoris]